METRPKALIVGAGIAGLSAAWWLDKAGWTSIIIEKASYIRDGGYIVSISRLGFDAVQAMHLQTSLDSIIYKFEENVVRDSSGNELIRLRYEDVHGGVENITMSRGDISHTLAKALPKTSDIRFDDTVTEISDDGTKVHATLRSGEIIEADLLIGTDGIRSSIRDKLWKDMDCLEHMGYSYAVYNIEENNDLQSDCVSFNSPGHLDIMYSLRGDRTAALHIWRDDQAKLQDRQSGFGVVREATAGGAKMVADIVDRAEEAGVSPIIDTLTMVTLPKWSKGRILLLGDSAHCLTLLSDQGAGMALASAQILSKELVATKDVSEALANHEKKLRPIIEKLQQRSRKMAAMYIPKSKFMYYLRNLLVRLVPASWIASWHANSSKLEVELTMPE